MRDLPLEKRTKSLKPNKAGTSKMKELFKISTLGIIEISLYASVLFAKQRFDLNCILI